MIDFQEMVRQFRMRRSNRAIARDLGAGRNTVAKYKIVAATRGWFDPETPLPALDEVRKAFLEVQRPVIAGPVSTVAVHEKTVRALRKEGVEIQALWQILRDSYGFTGSYSAVRRFVRKLEPCTPDACIRIETKPGEEAQVDFGSAGKLLDPNSGQLRKAWIFVMTLSWSRHQYAEIVFDQKVETWIALHIRAFEFIGGVPERIVIDNLKAAITKACFHDPQVQQAYRELAEHYGFLISPCRVRKPEHKGKVESGVRYVKRNALAGRKFRDINHANAHLSEWVMQTAGVRIHGTTHEKPLDRFEETEKAKLRPLPPSRYEVGIWKKVKLHPDCHVVFDYAYYSAPHRLVGQTLMVRATAKKVELFHDHEHVAAHSRAAYRGDRKTILDHLPPAKVQGLMPVPKQVREKAASIGPHTAELIDLLLGDRPVDRLRGAQGIVNMAKKHGDHRLEKACRRALCFDDVRYRTVRNILRKGLESEPLPDEEFALSPLPKTSIYARKPQEFLAYS